MIEKPPILQGNTNDQVRALRDYLMRLAGTLDGSIQEATVGKNVSVTVDKQGRQVTKANTDAVSAKTESEIKKSADELRSLIIKSADEVYQQMEMDKKEYEGTFLAQSEFYGSFLLNLDTQIETGAAGVVEKFKREENIEGLQQSSAAMTQYINNLNGEIRRGAIWDPSAQEYVIGIAISQKLSFTADAPEVVDNKNYYHLDSGQTFGLYTSTGWQFWLNGQKVGWFDSATGNLHVKNINVEGSLTVGDAIFEMNERFDIRPKGDGQ